MLLFLLYLSHPVSHGATYKRTFQKMDAKCLKFLETGCVLSKQFDKQLIKIWASKFHTMPKQEKFGWKSKTEYYSTMSLLQTKPAPQFKQSMIT